MQILILEPNRSKCSQELGVPSKNTIFKKNFRESTFPQQATPDRDACGDYPSRHDVVDRYFPFFKHTYWF